MLKFISRIFAVIGFLAVALILGCVLLVQHSKKTVEPQPRSMVLSLDFTRPIVEQSEASPLSLAMEDDPVALIDVLRAIEHAATDPRVKGIVARFGTNQPGMAQAQELRAALATFRAANKFTYAFGSDFGEFGQGNRAYYLASAFENIWLQPVGTVSLTGVALKSPFAKTALDKIGVVADFMQREEYKSFMEAGQRDGFSPLVKAEMQAMAEDLSGQIASGIADSRKWDVDHVKDLMARGPYTDEEAVQEGLITRLAYADELDDEMDRKAGKDSVQVDVGTYLGYIKNPVSAGGVNIALIHGVGLIMDKNVGGSDVMGEQVLGADDIAGAFDDAADDSSVKAILFRIDSPGGSPAASETIRRAMMNAQKQGKPVIVSMGATAASGGYWIAMNADKIVADPATLTGSIGVVAGKFAGKELLQKVGVSMDGVTTAENAGMWDSSATFTQAQRARVNALLDNTYHAFVSNVASARKIPMEKMPEIAKGRVWTGAQAVKVGLVDELGGYDVALKQVRQSLKLSDDALLVLEDFPQPPTAAEKLMRFLRRFGAQSAALSSSMQTLAAVQAVARPWSGLASFDHPVAARMQPVEGIHD